MTDKEIIVAIRAEIERLKKENNGSPLSVCNDLLSFIDSMQEKPKCMYSKDNFTDEDRKTLCDGCRESNCSFYLNEDLEVEFNRFLDEVEGVPRMWHSDEQTEWALNIARHFAIWQKQQIMKDAVDAFIYKGGIRLKEWPLPEKCGKHLDPVKVIIIKEDKV